MPEIVVARFFVSGYQRRAYDPDATEVTLNAVSRGEHNKAWARATPSGEIKMTVKNESAAAWFMDRLGSEIEVSFALVPPGNG